MSTEDKRNKLKKRCGDLVEKVEKILFEEDPYGLNFGDNVDEYEPEASTILPRLRNCRSASDTRIVIHKAFCYWGNVSYAGPIEKYTHASERIWQIWKDSGIG